MQDPEDSNLCEIEVFIDSRKVFVSDNLTLDEMVYVIEEVIFLLTCRRDDLLGKVGLQ